MLPHSIQGHGSPTFVLMHFLGGSHRTWSPTLPYLDRSHLCVALDTPGFGDAAEVEGYSVEAMVDHVDRSIRELGLTDCILVGHSMTGKVAVVLASRHPHYLRALILVAPSPPGPQPMTDTERDEQRAYDKTRRAAEAFVDESSAVRLPDDLREIAIADAEHVNLAAWRAWVDQGSREDLSGRLGVMDYPVLLICGGADQQVPSPDEQRTTTLKAFSHTQLEVIPNAGHLMPLQAPQALGKLMQAFAKRISPSDQ